jgi:hypothetical protein
MSIESFDDGDPEDRAYDHTWIAENRDRFALLARDGFQLFGRGAVLVNLSELILRKHSEEGHPFNYHAPSPEWYDAEEITPESVRLPLLPLLLQYSPKKEFVLLLVKYNRSSLHRVPLPTQDEMNLEIRGAYIDAEAEERQARLTCTDFWARQYHLTSPHTAEWLYRVSGPWDG